MLSNKHVWLFLQVIVYFRIQESYDRVVLLENLEPHSEYLIQAAVSNFYTEYLAEALGKSVIYKTKPGGEYILNIEDGIAV